jgi:soluble cytochrome b562
MSMKISKRQFKAALNVAHEAGFNSGRECTDADWVEHNFGNNPDDLHWRGGMDELIQDRDKVVKRIVKHEVKHAKMRKLKNVRKHWNVNLADHEKARGKNYVAAGCGLWSMQGELGVGKSATLPDLLAEYDFEGMDSAQVYASLDPTSTTSDNNESNASKLNETPTKEDV